MVGGQPHGAETDPLTVQAVRGGSHGLGGRGLTRQGIGQTLLALNRTLPSLPGQNQRIEIQPQSVDGQSFENIQGGDDFAISQQALEGLKDQLGRRWRIRIHPDQAAQGIEQRTCRPATQHLLSEAAARQHRSIQQCEQPVPTVGGEQAQPGR